MTKIYSKGSLYAADPKSTMVLYILQEGYCNVRCKHCYMRFQRDSAKYRDLNSAKKGIKDLLLKGYKVHLRGTEILLNPEYLSLFPLVGQNYIQTNGIILYSNHSLFQKLKKIKISRIIVTYPVGPEKIVDVPLKIVEEVIKNGVKKGFRMVVDLIVTKGIVKTFKQNSNYFEKICKKLVNFGASELRFVRLIPFSKELKRISPSPIESQIIIKESVRLEALFKRKIDVTRAGQMGFYDLRRELKEKYFGIKVPSPDKSGVMDCPAGVRLFVIDCNNKVYPCLYLMITSWQIGKFINGEITLKKKVLVPGKLHTTDCPAYLENYNKY